MRPEKPDLPRKTRPEMPSLRRATWFAVAGLATALLVGGVYLGYGIYLLMSGQTNIVSKESLATAAAKAIARPTWEAQATSFAETRQAEAAATAAFWAPHRMTALAEIRSQEQEASSKDAVEQGFAEINPCESGPNVDSDDGTAKATVQPRDAPKPPTNLYVTAQPDNAAHLIWIAPYANATCYRVERKQGDSAWETIEEGIPFQETTDFGLVSGETYTYRVITLADDAESAPSAQYILHVP